MGKRTGNDAGINMQMRREEMEQMMAQNEDQPVNSSAPGSMPRASDDVLKNRKVLKINRSKFGKAKVRARAGEGGGAGSGSNPFANVNLAPGSAEGSFGGASLMGNGASSTPPSTSVSVSGSLFGTGTSSSAGGMPSSLNGSSLFPTTSSSSSPAQLPDTASSLFGSSSGSSSLLDQKQSKNSTFPSSDSSSPASTKLPASSSLSSSFPSSSAAAVTGGSSSDTQSEEYLCNVAALNASFASWVEEQMKKDPSKPLTQGARNYIAYAKEQREGKLEQSEGQVANSIDSTSTSNSLSGIGTNGLSMFGSSTTDSSSASKAQNTPLFGGLRSSSGIGSGGGSLFGSSSSTSALSSNSFGQPAFGSSAPLTGAANGGDNGGAEDENAPLPADEETDIKANLSEGEKQVFRERSKMFCLLNKAWKSKGLGDLSVIKTESGGPGYIVLRSDAGRALATVPLFAGMKTSTSSEGKAHYVEFAAVSYAASESGEPEAENGGAAVPFKVKIKTAEQAEALKNTILELCS